MRSNTQPRGFSLVELLVVIGIISLLIAIALPAFSKAKESARIATTTATINTIGTGLEMFRADERLGGQYPPSDRTKLPHNPHLPDGVGKNKDLQVLGANLVVYALAGADLLGSAGIRNANGLPAGGSIPDWADDLSQQSSPPGLYRYTERGLPAVARTSFVDVSKMKFPKLVETSDGPKFEIPAGKALLSSVAFLDSFDQPILYYRANAGRVGMVCYSTDPNNTRTNNGIYNMADNENLTGARWKGTSVPGMDFGAGKDHFPYKGDNLSPSSPTLLKDPSTRDACKGTFAHTIYNPNVATPGIFMPHNAETFILLSAGPDGLFGTEDDIANFPTNK